MGEPNRRDFISLGVKLAILAGLPPYTVPKIADALAQITQGHNPVINFPGCPAQPDRRGEMLNHLLNLGIPELKKVGRPL